MPLPVFEYTPLSPGVDTRVLELQPSLDIDAPLRCNLRDLTLGFEADSAQGSYECISYTWGEPLLAKPLVMNDTAVSMATESLHKALSRFRLPTKIRRLWADAVCIDQNDPEDKARQISRMADVFRSASSVLIWLGDSEEGSMALEIIDRHARYKNHRTHDGSAEVSKASDILFSLPWWSRRWVIQEALLNANVFLVCRSVEMPWVRMVPLFARDRGCFDYLHQRVVTHGRIAPRPMVTIMFTLWKTHGLGLDDINRPTLMGLLNAFSGSECSNGHDRIYALAGFAEDMILYAPGGKPVRDLPQQIYYRGKIEVDYMQSTEELYMKFAWEYLHELKGSSWMGCLVDHALRRSDGVDRNGLPSWVPDWRLPVTRIPLFLQGQCRVRSVEAHSGHKRATLHGMVQGTVDAIIGVFPSKNDLDLDSWVPEMWEKLVQWSNEKHLELSQMLGPDADLTIWHILGSVLLAEPHGQHRNECCLVKLTNYLDLRPIHSLPGYTRQVDLRMLQTPESREKICSNMTGRLLFTSVGQTDLRMPGESRLIVGIGPGHTQCGDIVVSPGYSNHRHTLSDSRDVYFGGPWTTEDPYWVASYLLRYGEPLGSETSFKLVGECFWQLHLTKEDCEDEQYEEGSRSHRVTVSHPHEDNFRMLLPKRDFNIS
ncbi:uncharacterized protein JN550_008036 [Neoarthrinium moseri]|uniref:uncharacterized protein n=1 Tax=Neoarthrinium moseri TaxID=1658444 RepID=UPI001FDADCD4|nr:uncharacterized protein JN550_008036 [Neoarthrinium moseri]KAI1866058.1 hypothetical protein JN550_008036 [Neoarthrinium moseri]